MDKELALQYTAVWCRYAIFGGLLLAAGLHALFFWIQLEARKTPLERATLITQTLLTVGAVLYGCGAGYSTYTRIEKEFVPGLIPMAVGILTYVVGMYRLCGFTGPKEHLDLEATRSYDERRLEKLLGRSNEPK